MLDNFQKHPTTSNNEIIFSVWGLMPDYRENGFDFIVKDNN